MSHQEIEVNNQLKPSGFNHSFDVGIAANCGIEAACVFNHLCHWIIHNRARGKNLIQGKTWTYDSYENMCKYLPYLNARQIKYAIQKLLDSKIIVKGQFSSDKWDKTNWYALNDESYIRFSKMSCDETKLSDHIGQNCPIDKTNLSDVQAYTNTYTNQDTNTTTNPPKSEKPKLRQSGGGNSKISFDRQKNVFLNLTPEVLQKLKEAYPKVDVDQQLRYMILWLMSNTHREGNQAFITNWLKKSALEVPKPEVIPEDETPYEPPPELKAAIAARNAATKAKLDAMKAVQDEG